MPFTKCPKCRKVQQVVPALVGKEIGCMNTRCGRAFDALYYRMHSGLMSRIVFWFTIAFAIFMLSRWLWLNAATIFNWLG